MRCPKCLGSLEHIYDECWYECAICGYSVFEDDVEDYSISPEQESEEVN